MSNCSEPLDGPVPLVPKLYLGNPSLGSSSFRGNGNNVETFWHQLEAIQKHFKPFSQALPPLNYGSSRSRSGAALCINPKIGYVQAQDFILEAPV